MVGIWSKAGFISVVGIQLEYVLEQNGPTKPGARGVQHWLQGILDGIVQFCVGLDLLGDMAPRNGYQDA